MKQLMVESSLWKHDHRYKHQRDEHLQTVLALKGEVGTIMTYGSCNEVRRQCSQRKLCRRNMPTQNSVRKSI